MKKVTLGVFVFSIVALLGISVAAAFPFGFSKNFAQQELTEEEQAEIQMYQDSLRTAIENEDFNSWKVLMESQITEENFNNLVQHQKEMQQKRAEMEEFREQYCSENDCPDFGEMGFAGDFKGPMRHGIPEGLEQGKCPMEDSN